MIAVSLSKTVTVCRKVASYLATCAVALRSKVVVIVKHSQNLSNHSDTTVCKKKIDAITNFSRCSEVAILFLLVSELLACSELGGSFVKLSVFRFVSL